MLHLWPEGGRVMLSSTDERDTPCVPGNRWTFSTFAG
jgi:hypothetical protein